MLIGNVQNVIEDVQYEKACLSTYKGTSFVISRPKFVLNNSLQIISYIIVYELCSVSVVLKK